MKKSILSSFLIFFCITNSIAGVIILEGKYQSKNLYVQNGFAGNGVGFCTYEIRINGKVSSDEINSSSFEIDFEASAIKPGTSVIVEIKYKDDCTPKILNPEALKPAVTFEMLAISVDPNGLLNWSTKNETGSLPYIIEQYRWNKWVPVGEVKGSGINTVNTYSFQTTAHSGINKFRIKQVGYGGIAKISENVIYKSTINQPSFAIAKNELDIEFSSATLFEVYDAYGNIKKRGYGNSLNISNMEKGNYFLCYDNVMTDFKKK